MGLFVEAGAAVVAAAQVTLQEDVEDYEEVTPHLLERQLGGACGPPPPSDPDDSVTVSPDHGFERSSTVRWKWFESKGWIVSITLRRYALQAFVVSLYSWRNKKRNAPV
jgi:hypothetical protein